MNRLYADKDQVYFENHRGEVMEMPNLTALYQMRQTCEDDTVKERIQAIFDRDFGKVLVAEIMIDMNSPQIIERLHTGEISKTLGHVDNYNVILANELQQVKEAYEGDFEKACFAEFPYGMVVEEEKFKGYVNQTGQKTF